MAASTNPPANKEGSSSSSQQKIPPPSNGVSVNPTNNGASTSAVATPPATAETLAALRHNPGISVDWTPDEQSTLDDLLVKYASDSNIIRYAKIAMQLKDKTVRDVALRCNWLAKKESGKRRREDHNSSRKSKERKEKVATDSSTKSASHLTARPNGPSYAMPMIPVDNDDGISYQAIGGTTGELLEQNAQIFSQISANFATFQIHDNVNLLCKTRDNILAVLNEREKIGRHCTCVAALHRKGVRRAGAEVSAASPETAVAPRRCFFVAGRRSSASNQVFLT